jgi:glycosyltransferase involved in cell wall biosynthesis
MAAGAECRISIVITCYNLERFIGAAIESALSQEFAGTVEVIVVDDCSTDDSERIIRSYADVRYLRTAQNSGSLLAMITGLEEASYDIVCLLDGDDIWRPDKVRMISECFASDPLVAFVTHDLRFINSVGAPVDRPSRPAKVLNPAPAVEWSDRIRQGILMDEDFVWLGSALSFSRSVSRAAEFVEWARSLPDPVNTYQDWPLAFWIAALPEVKFGYIPEKLFAYRLHESNHSGDASSSEKALRNFRRTRNTVAAMIDIACTRGLPQSIRDSLNRRLRFLDYTIGLYAGRRSFALAGWLRSLRYLVEQGAVYKETARFVGIQILGASLFCRLAAKNARVR